MLQFQVPPNQKPLKWLRKLTVDNPTKKPIKNLPEKRESKKPELAKRDPHPLLSRYVKCDITAYSPEDNKLTDDLKHWARSESLISHR